MAETITAEIGTTGEQETLELSGNARIDIGAAVAREHYCQDSGCDIRAALDGAHEPFIAAALLSDATECPLVGAVAEHYGIPLGGDLGTLEGWENWLDHHRRYGRECRACGGYTYGTDSWEPEACNHCGASELNPKRLSDLEAKRISSEWHGGAGSALYALSSTGSILEASSATGERRDTAAEISYLLETETGSEDDELDQLGAYVAEHGERGPVDGWGDLNW